MSEPSQPPVPSMLAACARGEVSVAAAMGVSAEVLQGARSLAWLVAEAGRADLARTILEGCVALDEGDAWSYRTLSALALRMGDVDSAWRNASRAAALANARGDFDAEAALLVARSMIAAGRTEEARPWLSAACQHAAPQKTRATALALQGRLGGPARR
jgi:thioredoxin-like negative regulator of GroEL